MFSRPATPTWFRSIPSTSCLPRRPTARPRPAGQARSFFWSSTSSSSSSSPLDSPLSYTSFPQVPPDLSPLILAAVLHTTDSESEDDPTLPPPWTVVDLSAEGKGFGCLASRDLRRGERLLAERPLCIWPQGLSAEEANRLFKAMPEREQKIFMSLAKTEGEGLKGMDEILARRATNAFALSLPGSSKTFGFVFPVLARLNHSCLPNASQAMNFSTLRMEVYPLENIKTGTEINIEYLPSLITQTRSERQLSLRNSFGFATCKCEACTLPEDLGVKSDSRRREIKAISENLRSGGARADRKGTLEKMERLRILLEQEKYLGLPEFEDSSVANAYAVYVTLRARSQNQLPTPPQ